MAVLLLGAGRATAGEMELGLFAGVRYGGGFNTASGRPASLGTGFEYGATLDFPVGETFAVELLYSREKTDLSTGAGSAFDMTVERYMAGVREEKGEERTRFLGVFLMGLTRFAPGLGGFDSDLRFTVGVGLGAKVFLSKRFALRAEARGFYVVVTAGAGTVCIDGACLFRYSASGLWQGDVTAGAVILF